MNTLQKFFFLLKLANAITLDDGAMLTDWTVADQTGEADNQVVHFAWTDGENDFSLILTEEGIADGCFNDTGEFVVDDHEGDQVAVRFFKTQPLTLADIHLQ